ncbi:MAG: hypothetical protein J5640_04225 [Bacteroidales bacterium]|nr:hypothetical protein [Bacteroidales bacterium]
MKAKELYVSPRVGIYADAVEQALALSYNQSERTETLYMISEEEDL